MKWLRMRPADMNELNESTRWHEVYGGDPEGEVVGVGANGAVAATGVGYEQAQVARRKKAPVRTRRRGGGVGAGGEGGANGEVG